MGKMLQNGELSFLRSVPVLSLELSINFEEDLLPRWLPGSDTTTTRRSAGNLFQYIYLTAEQNNALGKTK